MTHATTETRPTSNTTVWTGRIMTGLAALFLLFDGVIHVMKIAPVVEAFAQLGYPATLARGIGVVELVCLILYVVPRTSVVGAILLTGYLGGAIASSLRVGNPLFSHVLFPVYVAMLLWGGLYLRDRRVRALIPLRSSGGK
jgi:hypothetical protein